MLTETVDNNTCKINNTGPCNGWEKCINHLYTDNKNVVPYVIVIGKPVIEPNMIYSSIELKMANANRIKTCPMIGLEFSYCRGWVPCYKLFQSLMDPKFSVNALIIMPKFYPDTFLIHINIWENQIST